MIQQILLYAYIFLGFATFCYWVMAVLAGFRMLANRAPGRSLLSTITTGVFKPGNYSVEGNDQREKLIYAMTRFMMSVAGMVIVVVIGVQTQG